MENNNKNSGVVKMVGGLIVIILAGIGFWKLNSSDSTTTPVNTGDTQTVSNTPVVAEKKYKDGTYTATGNYSAPSGTESIGLSLVLKDGIITSATVTSDNSKSPNTRKFQNLFIAGFNSYVIGKSIDSINLTVVNGSSLTPVGFMDALSQIESQALNS